MKRPLPWLMTSREFSIRGRLLVALLVLVQFIAPTWHVCEMGGISCCPPKTGDSLQHCERPGTEAADASVVSAIPEPHVENCLAKMLLGMPLQEAPSATALEFATLEVPSATATPQTPSIGHLPQPPSRGPPVFSL